MDVTKQVEDLCLQWEESYEKGQPISIEELCRDCPELLPAVRERVAALKSMADWIGRQPNLAASQDTSTPSASDDEMDEPTESQITVNSSPKPNAEGVEDDLGRFHVVGKIAKGGMGEVLRVYDPALARTLAVKIMLPKYIGNEDALNRFLKEARITGCLQHPGVAPIHELGRLPDKRLFFAMKLIEGHTLAEILAERESEQSPTDTGRWNAKDFSRILGIFEQICQTIAFAHSRGIIHRDIKPLNIMVGAFGEVQVMDWGLAKRIKDKGERTKNDEGEVHPASFIHHPSDTKRGAVLGTPAYMSPEQANGETDALDERCDVYSLGALLCELLTGKAPFQGSSLFDLLERVRQSDLTKVENRVRASGADHELVDLTLCCLAKVKDDRPRHAGEVADAVVAYQQQVRQRLQRAELERAAAQARAVEEQRRREVERQRGRLWLALAAAVVFSVIGFASAAVWYVRDQAQRQARNAARKEQLEKDVVAALNESRNVRRDLHKKLAAPRSAHALLSDLATWRNLLRSSRQSWQRAKTLVNADQTLLAAPLIQRLKRSEHELTSDEKDFWLADEIDRIRLTTTLFDTDKPEDIGGKAPTSVAVSAPAFALDQSQNREVRRQLADLFDTAGIKFQRGDPAAIAERIRASTARVAVISALEYWSTISNRTDEEQQFTGRLLEVLRRADPDPWRDRFRRLDIRADREALKQLADEVDPAQQPPHTLAALLLLLRRSGSHSSELFSRTMSRHPNDFWLHFFYGLFGVDRRGKVAALRVALALRPDSSRARIAIGSALLELDEDAEAEFQFNEALRIQPSLAVGLLNLGVLQSRKGNLQRSEALYRKALAIDPHYAHAHVNLAVAARNRGKLNEAVALYKKAIEFDPALVRSYTDLAEIYYTRHKFKDDAAAKSYLQKALRIDPGDANIYNHLGVLHFYKNDMVAAMKNYVKAAELNPELAAAHNNLGFVSYKQGDQEKALDHLQKAVTLEPDWPLAHLNLGNVYLRLSRIDEAITEFRAAVKLSPEYAAAHNNLGAVLQRTGADKEALEHLKQAITLDANYLDPHLNIGQHYLLIKNDADSAAKHFQTALKIAPNNALAKQLLGTAELTRAMKLDERNNLKAAIAAYRRAATFLPGNSKVLAKMASAFYRVGRTRDAEKAYVQALQFDPANVDARFNLGVVLHKLKRYDDAVIQYCETLARDPAFGVVYGALGQTWMAQGRWAEARDAARRCLEELPKNHGVRPRVQSQLRQCEQQLKIKSQELLVPKEKVTPQNAAKRLILADFCRRYHERFRDSARLCEEALSLPKSYTDQLAKQWRQYAAATAVLAATGKGKYGNTLTKMEKNRLSGKALEWLRADQQQWAKLIEKGNPLDARKCLQELAQLRGNPNFAAVREEDQLLAFKEKDQKAWQGFWTRLMQMENSLQARLSESQIQGALTAELPVRYHKLRLTAGVTYVIDMKSSNFDSYLKLTDGTKTLAENDDIANGDLNSRVIFMAPTNGNYQIVASSIGQNGRGSYEIKILSLSQE